MKTVLIYGLKNVIGGIENYLMMMHKYLHNELKFVFIVEETDAFIYTKQIEDNNGKIVFIPERHNYSLYRKKLQRVLKEYRAITDIFYVNVGHISFDIFPISMALSEKYHVFTHSHSAMQEPISSLLYRIRQDILRSIAMIRLSNMKVERLAVSERAGNYLYKGKTYKIISPGIEVSRFEYKSNIRLEVRKNIRLTDCFVLGFVGRLVEVKNPLFLLDILCLTKQSIPNAKLLIIGDGIMKEKMLEKAKSYNLIDDVVFVGEVSNTEDYYQAMDVLLAPSLSEGMPLGIMEAQSSGLPCICAKGNIPESIDVTGIVYFCELNSGAANWAKMAQDIMVMNIDRKAINLKVAETDLNIHNASKKLLKELC